MSTKLVTLLSSIFLATLSVQGEAQQLPKSGSINFHTGYKVTAEALTPADKHVLGHGSAVGVTFNDQGTGPLHGGPSNCLFTFLSAQGPIRYKIFCAFGDADGDRIFTDAYGTASEDPAQGSKGVNEIVGGTGKYVGIKGSGPWECRNAGANGELLCAQRLDYRLP